MKTFKMKLLIGVVLACTIGVYACKGGPESSKVVISDTCSLDYVVGAAGGPPLFIAPANSDLVFKGWIADAANGKVPKKVTIEFVNSKKQVQLTCSGAVGEKRADVAAALKTPSLESAGFAIKTKIQGVAPGEYEILLVGAYDDQIAICNSNRKITIK